MKTQTSKTNRLYNYPFGKSEMFKGAVDASCLQEFITPPMTQQEIAPPLYVWDRIAAVLDEQDCKKELLDRAHAIAFRPRQSSRRIALATITATFVACIFWFFL